MKDVGYSAPLGQACYFILTKNWFGWHPSDMPMNLGFLFPKSFYAIPVSDIRAVHCRVHDVNCHGIVLLEVGGKSGSPADSVFEFEITFLDWWIRAFSKAGVTIFLPKGYYTIRARLKQFQWFIMYVIAFLSFVLVNAIGQFLDPGNVTLYLGLSFLVFLIPQCIYWCQVAIQYWKKAGSR